MRSLVRWCLDRRPVVILATALVLLGGVLGATQLRQQLFPDFDFPLAIATIEAPGLDATSLDSDVAQPIERAVEPLEEVVGVSTVASDGLLRLYIELAYGSDSDAAEDAIAKQIDDLDLPAGIDGATFAGGFQEQAVVIATITPKDGDLAGASDEAAELRRDLEATEGVGRVDLAGGSDPRLQVTLTGAALARGVTAQQVATTIEAAQTRTNAGVLRDAAGIPTGVVLEGPAIGDVAGLRALAIPGVGTVGSVAEIREVDAADAGFATANGVPALSLSVFRETGKDEVATVDGTLEVLDAAEKSFGAGSVDVLYETASDIRGSIRGLILEGTLGAFFAVVVIFLFLRSIRGTLVAAISIPTSIVFGILVAWLLGLTINVITLAGLTIAVGRVIDDGIVVLENIHKHLERGVPRRQAMIDGTGEVATAIASSTIATAAVFLPIGLVGGLISEIFLSFSIIVTAALLASLLVAVTIIPVVGAYVLRPSDTPHDPETDRLSELVVPATRFGIKWRWIVIPTAFLTMIGVFIAVAMGAVPTQFLPDDGRNQLYGTAQLAPGTTAAEARTQLKPLEERFAEVDGLEDLQLTYGIASGNAAFDPTVSSSTAEYFFSIKEGSKQDADEVETALRAFGEREYELGFGVQRISNGPPSGTFQVNIDGEDQAKIAAAAQQITDEVLEPNATKWGLVEIEAQAAQAIPQLVIRRRADADITPEALQAALAGISGTVPAGTSGDVPITVAADSSLAADPAALRALPVATSDGRELRLGDVATFERVESPAFVNRVEGELSGSITARLTKEDTAGTNKDIRAAVEKLDLAGVELDWEQGDQEFTNQMFTDMGLAMAVAIVLVFFVLVLFFGSIAQPFTILAPIMFSFIGSFGALIVTGRPLGLPAMIGQLLLIGIIVSNSILLVDATIRLRRAGVRRDEAIIRAARLRVRPVLMTASATIAALLPLSLGISGEGGIISQSLGTVVIGGLLVATLLTLVIVPAFYRLFDRDHDLTDEDIHPRDVRPVPPTEHVHAPLV